MNFYLLAFLGVLFASLGHLLMKFTLGYTTPLISTFYESIFTGLIFLIPTLKKKKLHWPNFLMVSNSLIKTFGVFCLFKSIDIMGPIHIGVLGRLQIVFGFGFAHFIANENLTRKEILSSVVIMIGSFLFVYKGHMDLSFHGFIYAVLFSLSFAFSGYLAIPLKKEYPASSLLFYQKVLAIPLIILVMIFCKEEYLFGFGSSKAISFLALNTVITNGVGLWVYYYLVQKAGLFIPTVAKAFGPLVVMLISWPFFPVSLGPLNIIGLILLLCALLILAKRT